MYKFLLSILITILTPPAIQATTDLSKKLTVLFTTDVHGHFFPYDFIVGQSADGSLSRVASFVEQTRVKEGRDHVLFLDNGDILQGQPTVYYYNYIDTADTNIANKIYHFLEYDAATIGNHDVETGHKVYDRWIEDSTIPILGANVIDVSTGKPYLKPYAVFDRGGFKIAVIGLLTPAIPAWLPEKLWSGLRFDPMEETARKWVTIVKEIEHPDIIIGLFHSGHDFSKTTAGYIENASLKVARNVDGFDAVFMGHDHQIFCDNVVSPSGKIVVVLNPANNAHNVGQLNLSMASDGHILVSGEIINVDSMKPSESFTDRFKEEYEAVKTFVDTQVTEIDENISTRDAYFGPSAFMTLLHNLQLEISGADISMAAPLTFDGAINKGSLHISDMFTLYKYENTLSTLKLTGKEIKNYLEYSYSLWINTAPIGQNHLMRYASDSPTPTDNRLKNPSYNFDSAAGIDYIVDITRPARDKVIIKGFSDGRKFEPDSTYTVAINSYRAGGGGNHLTEGIGLTSDELRKRIITTTDKDLRYYLIRTLERKPKVKAVVNNNWKFVPEDDAKRLSDIDRRILFGHDSAKNQK